MNGYKRQYYSRICCNSFNSCDYAEELAKRIHEFLKEQHEDKGLIKVVVSSQEFDVFSITIENEKVTEEGRFNKQTIDTAAEVYVSCLLDRNLLKNGISKVIEEYSNSINLNIVDFTLECFEIEVSHLVPVKAVRK